MKSFLSVLVVVLLLVLFTNCGESYEAIRVDEHEHHYSYDVELTNTQPNQTIAQSEQLVMSEIPDQLYFASLSEFLSARSISRLGGEPEMPHLVEQLNFLSLDWIELPIGIPEAYKLYSIEVNEGVVLFLFLPEQYLVSEDTIHFARNRRRHFGVTFMRWQPDWRSPMDAMLSQRRITQNDLMYGRYYFRSSTLEWVTETERILMSVPIYSRTDEGHIQVRDGFDGYITFYSLEELTSLAETFLVDLNDDDLVDFLIQHDMPPRELSFNLGGTSNRPTTPTYMPAVNVPQRAEILDFLISDYSGLDTFAPTRLGYRLAGWYLDADFTTPVDNTTRMPGHEITLYARWSLSTTPDGE